MYVHRDSAGNIVEKRELRPLTIAKNAAGAAGRVMRAAVNHHAVKVSDEEQARRLSICKGCEWFTGSRCTKCGCVMRWKTKLATESCPIGKW